jgi:hypothetical protein
MPVLEQLLAVKLRPGKHEPQLPDVQRAIHRLDHVDPDLGAATCVSGMEMRMTVITA